MLTGTNKVSQLQQRLLVSKVAQTFMDNGITLDDDYVTMFHALQDAAAGAAIGTPYFARQAMESTCADGVSGLTSVE